YSYLFRAFWQAFRFTFHREVGIPFAGTALTNGESFDLATGGTMQDDLDMSNARCIEFALLVDLEAALGIGDAVIAIDPTKTGIARIFTCFDPSEEGFHGKIKPHNHILQDLGVDS